MEEKLNAALQAGTIPKLDARKMEVRLSLGPRKPVILVKADGTVTSEGKIVYEKLGVPAPSIYPYEQGMINGKWVKNFPGAPAAKTLVVGRGGKPTAKGEAYFKYNRDEYHAEFPVRLARPGRVGSNVWQLDKETFTYKERDLADNALLPLTVGKVGKAGRPHVTVYPSHLALHMVPEDRREAHTRDAAKRWVEQRQTILLYDPLSGETKEWQAVLYDSPHWFVYDPERPIRINRKRENMYDRSAPSTDEILERPLRKFFVVPDDCYRPWDLHPRSFVDDSKCAVSMLHTCFLKEGRAWVTENGRRKRQRVFHEAMREDEIKDELDKIFKEMGYKEAEYPFEGTWRTDGVTSSMVIEFCKRYNINCTCLDAKNRIVASHHAVSVTGERLSNVMFFVRDDHCFWYGTEARGTSGNKAPSSANAFSQRYRGDRYKETEATRTGQLIQSSEDEGEIDDFRQRDIRAFFASDKTPPMTEWKPFYTDLLQKAATSPAKPFESFREATTLDTNSGQANKEKKKLYFWTTDAAFAEAELRRLLAGVTEVREQFGIKPCYGASPDKVTLLMVKARGCPTMFIKEVPEDWRLFQAMYEECARSLGLDPTEKVLYKGEGKAQLCERMRVEIMKHYSRKPLTRSERLKVKNKYGGTCANCECELEDGQWESDHIVGLWQGGKDTVENQEPLCLPCHSEKSEHQRLYQGARKTIESTFSREVLEMFYAAPRPQQLVFGDGKECFLELDQIRARSNALLKNQDALPILGVIDDITPTPWHDDGIAQSDRWYQDEDESEEQHRYDDEYVLGCIQDASHFWYIDAGEPLDKPLEALPYMGPRWYWRANAEAILRHGYSKAGKIDRHAFKYVLNASQFMSGCLDKYYTVASRPSCAKLCPSINATTHSKQRRRRHTQKRRLWASTRASFWPCKVRGRPNTRTVGASATRGTKRMRPLQCICGAQMPTEHAV